MTWFKVDDGFWSHPKTATLSDAAVTLWVRGGSYCCQHLTDGFVARGALRFLGAEAGADELVEASLWDVKDSGWEFHDWAQYQPSRESVLDERASNSARQAVARNPELRDAVRKRDGNNCRYCGQIVEWNNKRGGAGGTYDHVNPKGSSTFDNLVVCCRGCNARKGRRTPAQAGMNLIPVVSESDSNQTQVAGSSGVEPPTRPDPTRPVVSTDVDTTPVPRKRGTRSKPKTHLPEDFLPQTKTIESIRAEFPHATSDDLEYQNRKFRDHWAKVGTPMADWDATWRNWIRTANERGELGHRGTPVLRAVNGGQSTVDDKVSGWMDLANSTPGRELE